MRQLLGVLLAVVLGLGPDRQPPACRVVEQITVEITTLEEYHTVIYTDQEHMILVLDYLRDVETHHAPAVATEGQSQYHITLHLSDGAIMEYHQIGISLFAKGDGPWQAIEPAHGVNLPLLLALIPEDKS